jgi:hypothetical protein
MTWYSDLPHDQAGGDGGVRSITQMVVIHATDNTASDEGEAGYAETRSDHTSAHFYSDEDSVIQALDTDHIAFGCFPTGNSRSVQVEISGLSNHLSDASLRRVAPVVARVCQEYGLPIQHVDSLGLRNGIRGISGHLDVTYAWGEGDHTDPGTSFPWQTFIGYVAAAANPPTVRREDGIDMFTLPEGFGCVGRGDPIDITRAVVIPVDPGPGYVAWVSMAADFGSPTVRAALQQDGEPWAVQAAAYRGQRVSLGRYTKPGQLSVTRAAKDDTELAAANDAMQRQETALKTLATLADDDPTRAALLADATAYDKFKPDKVPVGISVRYLPA